MTQDPRTNDHRAKRKRSPSHRFERKAKEILLPLAYRVLSPRHQLPPLTDFSSGHLLASARRILVIRQDFRLGNMVLVTPFLKELRRLAPQAHIEVLIDSRFADVIAGAPWFDRLIIQHRKRMIYRPWEHPLHLAALRRGKWDLAFDLSNPDSFSSHGALILTASGAKVRAGFYHPRAVSTLNAPVVPPISECHYSLAPLLLLSAFGVTPNLPAIDLSPLLTPKHPNNANSIIINPGGRGDKRWPSERFLALIKSLLKQKLVTPCELLLIGGPAEKDLIGNLATAAGGLRTKLSSTLPELVNALAGARLYIGCDAGPLHVAAAAGVPTLALFLTSNPIRYAPLGSKHSTILFGEGSRRWLRTSQNMALISTPESCLPWPDDFAEKLYSHRPEITSASAAGQSDEEINFLTERIKQTLRSQTTSL